VLPSTRLECEVIIDSKLNGIIDLYLQVANIPWIQISNRFFYTLNFIRLGKGGNLLNRNQFAVEVGI